MNPITLSDRRQRLGAVRLAALCLMLCGGLTAQAQEPVVKPPVVKAPVAKAPVAKAPVAKPPSGQTLSDDEKGVLMWEALADAAQRHSPDCDKMGDALQVIADQNRELSLRLRARIKGMTPKERAEHLKVAAKFAERTVSANRRLTEAATPCIRNKKVFGAFSSM